MTEVTRYCRHCQHETRTVCNRYNQGFSYFKCLECFPPITDGSEETRYDDWTEREIRLALARIRLAKKRRASGHNNALELRRLRACLQGLIVARNPYKEIRARMMERLEWERQYNERVATLVNTVRQCRQILRGPDEKLTRGKIQLLEWSMRDLRADIKELCLAVPKGRIFR